MIVETVEDGMAAICVGSNASSSPGWNELLSSLRSLRSPVNLHRPSDLLSVHCHAATCSLALVSLPPRFFSSFWGEWARKWGEFAVLRGGGGERDRAWVCGEGLGRFGLTVSMVISLCVGEVIWDNGAEELKFIVEGMATCFSCNWHVGGCVSKSESGRKRRQERKNEIKSWKKQNQRHRAC